MPSYTYTPSGGGDYYIVNAVEALAMARSLGWDTSWWEDIANTITIKSDTNPETRSVAHILITRAAMNATLSKKHLTHDITLPGSAISADAPPNPYGLANSITYQGWVFREARAIDPSVNIDNYIADPVPTVTPDQTQLVLMTFEDVRCVFNESFESKTYNYVYSTSHDAVNEDANPSDNDDYEVVVYDPDTLNSGSTPWGWVDILNDIKNEYLPFGHLINPTGFDTIRYPAGESGEEVKPENLSFGRHCKHKTPWELFCAILEATGHTIKYDPTTLEFTIVPLGTSTSAIKTALNAIFTADPVIETPTWTTNPEHLHNSLPEKVRVVFPSAPYSVSQATRNSQTEGTVPQDLIPITAGYSVEQDTDTLADGTITVIPSSKFIIHAEGYLYRTTTRYEQTSPSPQNLRVEVLEHVAEQIATRYVKALEIPHTEWTLIGARSYAVDHMYPEYRIRFGTVKNLQAFNDAYDQFNEVSIMLAEYPDLGLGAPETTVFSRPPICFDKFPQANADVFYPHEKFVTIKVTQTDGIPSGKEGGVEFLRPMPVVDTDTTPDSIKWEFSGDESIQTVVNLTSETLSLGTNYAARFDYRIGKWVVITASTTGPIILEGIVSSYDDANLVATLTGPPQELPTWTPDASTVTKAYNKYNVSISPSDTVLAIYWEAVHTDGTHGQVDWVILPTGSSTPIRVVNIDPKSVGQSSGSPVTPHRKRYFSGTLGTEPFDEEADPPQQKIWVYFNDHHNDMIDVTGGESADYLVLPVHSQWNGLYAGTWNPETDQEEDQAGDGDPVPNWDSSETNYGNGVGEIAKVKHDGYYWIALESPVGSGPSYEPGTVPTYWEQGEAIEEDDERDLYRIDGLPPGVVPGFTITEFDPAQDIGTDNPFFSTGKFQTYVEDESGQMVYGPILDGVRCNLEETIRQGINGFIMLGLGKKYWLFPSCKIGSGFDAEDWTEYQEEE